MHSKIDDDLNISYSLEKSFSSTACDAMDIGFSSIRKSIDRLNISVRNKGNNSQIIKDFFKSTFHSLGSWKTKTGYVYSYDFNGIHIRFTTYTSEKYWLSISISNPSDEIQLILRDFFNSMDLSSQSISISQIEFALDFYATEQDGLSKIKFFINQAIVLKHSRENSFSTFKTTSYQGHKGNIRAGKKGVRCYKKTEGGKDFYRVELQANKGLVRDMGLTINSLPIHFDDMDISKQIIFRQALNKDTLNAMAKSLAKKKLRKIPKQRGRLARRVMQNAFRNEFLDLLRGGDLIDESTVPLAQQISLFKKVKAYYGTTCKVDQFFPKINLR